MENTSIDENVVENTTAEIVLENEELVVEDNPVTEQITEITLDADFSSLENLIEKNNDLLLHVYTAQLFFIGVAAASVVVVLLYKFIRKFF